MKIVLASSSTRRKEILSRLNIPFTIDCKNIIEPKYNPLNMSPVNYCKKLSKIRAKSISLKYNNTLIIGADTIVLLNKNLPKILQLLHRFSTHCGNHPQEIQ